MPRVRRSVLFVVAGLVAIVLLFFALNRADLLALSRAAGTSSMAPTLPPCNGRTIAEGVTYRFRDPHRGEIALFHARGTLGSTLVPDPSSRDLAIGKRVIGIPGDTVSGHDGRVFVNGKKADDIVTDEGFSLVRLDRDEYFLLGDNRSYSQDSRAFGPVPRNAIFARVILIYWPLGRFGGPGYDRTGTPPGPSCGG